MADDLQYGINQACSYFYGNYKDARQILDKVAAKDTEVQVKVRDMSVLFMLGVGYMIAKGLLFYRGHQHYAINLKGFDYYKSLVKNGDIVP